MGNDSAMAYYDFENPIYQVEDEGEEDCEVPGEQARLLQQEEKTIQPHEEPVDTVNFGIEEDKKEVKVGANLEPGVKKRLTQLLHDYVEVFAWSYEDMPGLDANIMVQRLPIKEDFPLAKQKVRHMRPDMSEKIKAEVMKQFNARFLLPHIDILVDNTAQHKVFSFMDGFSCYNQIKMAVKDMEKTTFVTQWGIFC